MSFVLLFTSVQVKVKALKKSRAGSVFYFKELFVSDYGEMAQFILSIEKEPYDISIQFNVVMLSCDSISNSTMVLRGCGAVCQGSRKL